MFVSNGQNNMSTLYILSADRREHVSSTLQGATQTLATFHMVTCYGSIRSCCFFGLSTYQSQVSFPTFYHLVLKADSSVCFSHYIFIVSTISLEFTSQECENDWTLQLKNLSPNTNAKFMSPLLPVQAYLSFSPLLWVCFLLESDNPVCV